MSEKQSKMTPSPEIPERRRRWSRWAPLLLIWLLAAGIRLVLSQSPRTVWGDEPFYLWLGKNWILGEGYQFMGHPDVHHGPLLPLFSGLLYLVTRDMALASEILYVLFGSLLILPIYALGRELYHRRVGLAAAALIAVFPALTVAVLHWGTMTEPLYMFFVYLGLWTGLVAARLLFSSLQAPEQRMPLRLWPFSLAGLSFGLAYLTRPEAVGYVVLSGAFFVLVALLCRGLRRGSFWLGIFLYVVGFGIAFLPYGYYVSRHTGAWMVSEKVGVTYLTGIGLAYGDAAAFDRATWGLDSTGLETFFFSSESYNVSMLELVLADPKTFAQLVYMNAQRFVRVLIDWTVFPYLLTPLVVLGLFDQGWTRKRTLQEAYLLLSVGPILTFILFFIQARYLVAVVPILVLWAARGLLSFGDWLVATLRTVWPGGSGSQASRPLRGAWPWILQIAPVILVMAGLMLAYPRVHRRVTNVGSFRPAHRIVGQRLTEITSGDTVIMCRYPAIAFHAQRQWVPTPNASWPEILRYARHKGADYFVVDERELAYRPQFDRFVTGEGLPPQLERVHSSVRGGERIVVYKLIEQ